MLKVRIISPETAIFEGEVEHIIVPGDNGSLGILPGHSPLYAQLIEGVIQLSSAGIASVPIAGGIMRVESDTVLILTGY